MSTENQQAGGPEAVSTPDEAPVADPVALLAEVSAERDKLAAENAERSELLLRRQAEFENFRKRTERDRSEFIQFAGMEFVRSILPIVDDFERALSVAPAECVDSDYKRGIELIHQRLLEILKKQGLEPIEAVGKSFDPNIHQAVDRVQTDQVDDQQILEEYQRGYNFKRKLLRPAMVKVAVKPS